MNGHDVGNLIAVSALAGYSIGVPVSIGVGLAAGLGPASILLCPFWPFTALVWFGYWLAA